MYYYHLGWLILNHERSTTICSYFLNEPIKLYKKSDARADVVVKFGEVSDSVWVGLKAVITEKTTKEEGTKKNHFNDNYN